MRVDNYYSTIYGKLLESASGLQKDWFSTRIEECVYQDTSEKLIGTEI
jgi:hypothetical protein